MLFRTHITLGFLTGLIFVKLLNPANQVLFVVLAVMGSAFPDIDNPKSKVGRLIKPVGHLFEHRGIFHSIIAVLFFSGAIALVTDHYLAFGLGYFSHLVADSLTPSGIGFFYPFKFRIRGFMRTGSIFDHIIFAMLLISSAMLLL